MNFTTAGTVPFSFRKNCENNPSKHFSGSFSNKLTSFSCSFSSPSIIYEKNSQQKDKNNNSSSTIHKSPRCFNDLSEMK